MTRAADDGMFIPRRSAGKLGNAIAVASHRAMTGEPFMTITPRLAAARIRHPVTEAPRG